MDSLSVHTLKEGRKQRIPRRKKIRDKKEEKEKDVINKNRRDRSIEANMIINKKKLPNANL